LVKESTVDISVNVPQRHVSHCLQRAFSSTQAMLMNMIFWIQQWWMFGFFSNAVLDGVGVLRGSLISASASNTRDSCVYIFIFWD
jgi:hypothetical protein